MLVALGALMLVREPGARPAVDVALIAVLLTQSGSCRLAWLWLQRRYQ